MTATDELRRMLDERGVEHEGGERSMRWRDRYGIMIQAFPLANGELGMGVWSCTPEQAVEATLGRGTCHEAKYNHHWRGCSECGYVWENMYAAGFQIGPNYCPMCGRKVVTDG